MKCFFFLCLVSLISILQSAVSCNHHDVEGFSAAEVTEPEHSFDLCVRLTAPTVGH